MRRPYEQFPIRPLAAFEQEHAEWRPVLNMRLGRKHIQPGPWFKAIVDTGSPFCLFRADLGHVIGMDVRSGTREDISGVVGGRSEPAYFHDVNLYIEHEWIVEAKVGFVYGLSWGGLLGRRGFFENFRVAFDHSTDPPELEIERIHRA